MQLLASRRGAQVQPSRVGGQAFTGSLGRIRARAVQAHAEPEPRGTRAIVQRAWGQTGGAKQVVHVEHHRVSALPQTSHDRPAKVQNHESGDMYPQRLQAQLGSLMQATLFW